MAIQADEEAGAEEVLWLMAVLQQLGSTGAWWRHEHEGSALAAWLKQREPEVATMRLRLLSCLQLGRQHTGLKWAAVKAARIWGPLPRGQDESSPTFAALSAFLCELQQDAELDELVGSSAAGRAMADRLPQWRVWCLAYASALVEGHIDSSGPLQQLLQGQLQELVAVAPALAAACHCSDTPATDAASSTTSNSNSNTNTNSASTSASAAAGSTEGDSMQSIVRLFKVRPGEDFGPWREACEELDWDLCHLFNFVSQGIAQVKKALQEEAVVMELWQHYQRPLLSGLQVSVRPARYSLWPKVHLRTHSWGQECHTLSLGTFNQRRCSLAGGATVLVLLHACMCVVSWHTVSSISSSHVQS